MGSTIDLLLPANGRAAVMGILNITPDSFSDGGHLYQGGRLDVEALLARASEMVDAGADILDVGGESTRPGASPVAGDEELARVLPVIRFLKKHFDTPVSVDTSNPEVMTAAAEAGADFINDVRALSRPGAIDAVARSGMPVCLMHMPAEPEVMQKNPQYDDVVFEVKHFLQSRADICVNAGIPRDKIILDPGFGFGKTLGHNLALVRRLAEFGDMGYPVLVGVSRKRMVGALLDRKDGERAAGSVAMAMLAVQRGARIVRVHDVAPTVDALTILNAVEGNET